MADGASLARKETVAVDLASMPSTLEHSEQRQAGQTDLPNVFDDAPAPAGHARAGHDSCWQCGHKHLRAGATGADMTENA